MCIYIKEDELFLSCVYTNVHTSKRMSCFYLVYTPMCIHQRGWVVFILCIHQCAYIKEDGLSNQCLEFISVFSVVRVARSLVFCVLFCILLYLYSFSFGHCVVCPSIGIFKLSFPLLNSRINSFVKCQSRSLSVNNVIKNLFEWLVNNVINSLLEWLVNNVINSLFEWLVTVVDTHLNRM